VTPELLGTIGVFISAACSTAGFIGFTALARFWRSRGGWHVFWYMLVLTWVLDLAVVRVLFGEADWFAWLRAGSLTVGMPLVLAWRAWIIFDLQLLRRHRQAGAYRKADSQPAGEEETYAA
jgi:FtsH-binding integral membrane protein